MEKLLLLAFVAMAVVCVSRATDPTENEGSDVQYFQGDILLTKEQRLDMEATSNPNDPFAPMHAVVKKEDALWPNGILYYVLDSSLNDLARSAIQAAMDDYTTHTCIRFQQRTNQADYVKFLKGSGCYSYIGKIGGAQEISIGTNCEYKGIVIHEIFHALGRWHEQSRPDRDQYVEILTQNIYEGFEGQFEKQESRWVTTQGVTYDYGSLMHYGAYAFSKNGQPTIRPKQSGVSLDSLGQREGLSSKDIQHVLAVYCSDVPSSWSAWSAWSSCSQTCNGGTRTRTRTCNGGGSCEGSNIDTETCSTQNCPIAPAWGSWTTWSGCSASCGGGRQTRQRQCVGGNTCTGKQKQYRDCNTKSCPQSEVHIGCNLVPSESTNLKLLENTTPELSDNPLTRTEPVAKCGLAATKQGYKYFGVSTGYCISGSNNKEHYNNSKSYSPGSCKDGVGAVYSSGRYAYYYMDVYEVTGASSFTASADNAINLDSAATVPPPLAVGSEASGVAAHKYSLLLLSISLVTVLAKLLY